MNKHYTRIILISLTLIFFNSCAGKTPIIKPSTSNLSTQALIIGSFSRPKGKVYFRESSITIFDLNHKVVKNIFNTGKEDITSLTPAYTFTDDFSYTNSNGSIFSFLLPEGEYYISAFYTGFGAKGFTGNFYKKISVHKGEIIYIGDLFFQPILKKGFLTASKIARGAFCTISNQINRDYSVFKNKFKTNFNKKNIITQVKKIKFNLGNYSDYTNYSLGAY